MDDVKNQFKGFVKKLNNPFAPTSRFKGEGHRLGSGNGGGQESTSSEKKQGKAQPGQQQPQQGGDWRKLQQERWERERGHDPRSAQTISQPSKASPTTGQSQPSKPTSSRNDNVYATSGSLDQLGAPIHDGSYEVGISEALQAQKFGHAEPTSNPHVNLHRDERSDLQKHASESSSRDSHMGFDGSEKSSVGFDEVPTSNFKMGRDQTKISTGFDPFSSHIGSLSSSANSDGLQMFQCPVCGSWWRTEKEVNAHVDECLSQSASTSSEDVTNTNSNIGKEKTNVALGVLLSSGPSSDTLDVIVRIFCNIVNSPESEKFRKIRLSNPKIHDTVGMALGGVELLEAVGFDYHTEEDEIWVVMGSPSADQIEVMKGVISELEACILGPSKEAQSSKETTMVHRKVDRQVRVFHAAPENLAAKMELPDSFFLLSAAELREEAAARKKKLEDSQLLISKVSREKRAAASKRRYKAAIIRIQFPDGVVLQGMFLPWEPTSAIYEFVSSSLRDPSTRFDLVAPVLSKNQIIPSFADGATKIPTLEEASLVPATLVKFQCVGPDSLTFTGLHPDLLAVMEPLSSATLCLR